MKRGGKGFTVMEMLVVLAIIAIIATLAVPRYIGSVAKDQVVESLKLVEQLEVAVERYQRETGSLPPRNKDAGIPEPDKLPGNYVERIELKDGAFHIYFGNKAVGALQGKILSVRALTVPGSPSSPISWLCGYSVEPKLMTAAGENRSSVQPPGLLPFACRQPGS